MNRATEYNTFALEAQAMFSSWANLPSVLGNCPREPANLSTNNQYLQLVTLSPTAVLPWQQGPACCKTGIWWQQITRALHEFLLNYSVGSVRNVE
jgi:hypothetical protein